MYSSSAIHHFLLALLLTVSFSAAAQTSYGLIDEDMERAAGHYHHYEAPVPDSSVISRPEGYVPFYISHYGRHGCRWHTSDLVYNRPLKYLEQFARDSVLTAEGEELLEQLRIIAADARGRGGELTPRGVREHRGIAERMYASYPEVFSSRDGKTVHIESRSTAVTRCILSMCAFNERLKELQPGLSMTRTAYARDLDYMINRQGAKSISRFSKASSDSLLTVWLEPDRFLHAIISDDEYIRTEVKDPHKLMYWTYQIASILQDTDYLDMDLYHHFTEDEIDDLWRCENGYVYLTIGPSAEYGDHTIPDAKPLLLNIISTADAVISGKSDLAASLRFGHDQALVPLYALMQIKGTCDRVRVSEADKVWNVSDVSPMGTNIQFIFFRPAGRGEDGDILVRILRNEKEAELPVKGAPFYPWKELREFLLSRCR